MADRQFFSDITPEGVIHYPHLDQPDTNGKFADGKYKVTLAIPREGSDFSKLKALVVAAAKQEWGDTVDMNTVRKPFINGDAETLADGTPDPLCAGRVILRMKSKNKPLVVGIDRKALPPGADPVHAGDFGIANVTACSYVQGGNKGVSFWLSGLMITRRGERIGGVSASKLFGGASLASPNATAPLANAPTPVAAAPSDLSLFS